MYPTEKNKCAGIFIKEQVDSLKKEGVEIDVLSIFGKKHSPFKYFFGIIKVLYKTIFNKYDLVHAHYGYSGIVARIQWKYPLIVTFHGSDVNLSFQRFFSRLLVRHIAKGIVVSERLKELIKSNKCEVIPCGVNMALMKPMDQSFSRKKLNLSLDKKYVLFCGNKNDKIKRYDIFKEVMKLVKNKIDDVEELIMYNIPYEETPYYYNSANVMVLTSDYEGSPMSVKEAISCNLPVVARDVGDIKKIIGNINGCYITSDKIEEIAEKVIMVLKMNKRIDGREKIKEFALENIAKKIIKVYEKVRK